MWNQPFLAEEPPASFQQEPAQPAECLHWRRCRRLHVSQICKCRGGVKETPAGLGNGTGDQKPEELVCGHCLCQDLPGCDFTTDNSGYIHNPYSESLIFKRIKDGFLPLPPFFWMFKIEVFKELKLPTVQCDSQETDAKQAGDILLSWHQMSTASRQHFNNTVSK